MILGKSCNLVPDFIYFNPVNDIQTIQNKISDTSGEIVMYQPDETIRLEVRLGEDTVWLSQQQMAELFMSSRTNIVEHIQHIYSEKELEEISTCRNFRQVRQEGKRMVTRDIPMYNLDMIISVGYRINSKRGTIFRQWANKVLKDYLLKGYSVNKRFEQLEQRVSRTPFTLMRDLSPAMLTEHLGNGSRFTPPYRLKHLLSIRYVKTAFSLMRGGKAAIWLGLVLLCLFSSCSKDDVESEYTIEDLYTESQTLQYQTPDSVESFKYKFYWYLEAHPDAYNHPYYGAIDKKIDECTKGGEITVNTEWKGEIFEKFTKKPKND